MSATAPRPDLPELSPARQVAARWGVSTEAVEVLRAAEPFDLHLDTFIQVRLARWDVGRRHRGGPLGRHLFGHGDLPRLRDGGWAGAAWSITTNPARGAARRWLVLLDNIARLRDLLARQPGVEVVRDLAGYRAARARGHHAAFLAIQGGNALEAAPHGPASIPDGCISRVTLVHLTSSALGETSSPARRLARVRGLTPAGRLLVEQLDAARILVDLAHAHPRAFWEAVDVHDASLPLVVTHTGVQGVHPHWRNVDDRQLRAVADTGGVVGILFAPVFLAPRGRRADAGCVLAHLQHVVDVVGEDHAALGTDYDGWISPPPDLPSVEALPRLVQRMLDAGWSAERVHKVLGGNALRVIGRMRPGRVSGGAAGAGGDGRGPAGDGGAPAG